MKKIVITRGTTKIEVIRPDVIEVKESSDGLVFMMKGGFMFTFTDTDMPTHAKINIIGAVNNFPNANVEINLLNYAQPASLVAD